MAAENPAKGPCDIRVTLLGTGVPTPVMERFGPSILVEAGGETLLFDAGRGVLQHFQDFNRIETLCLGVEAAALWAPTVPRSEEGLCHTQMTNPATCPYTVLLLSSLIPTPMCV